ncbi:hypothetical protein G3A43_08795 [Paraburkholderia aspalathi]|nr:hypothetical protein [Paraburkholderia aspalathi]MBK3780355.1 hypothetical protein [Paraburkholderia aspalathi]
MVATAIATVAVPARARKAKATTARAKKSAPAVEKPKTEQREVDWYDLLEEAVREPGQLAAAYKFFHQYSLSNRWLASTQLRAMGLPLTPINTFKGWLGAERPVQKDQKATIWLNSPVPVRSKKKDDETGEEDEKRFTRFVLRRHWFHMGQTAGAEYQPKEPEGKEWSVTAAMEFYEIREQAFEFTSVTDTKRLGWARGNEISVSPLDANPVYGRIREMARILLGHTAETPAKNVPVEADQRDIEAETTAYLVAATLGIPGIEEGRMRLQLVLEDSSRPRIPDILAKHAFSAADKLLNAGYC